MDKRVPPADPTRRALGQILAGCSVGFFGLLLIWGAEKLLPSSAARELIALAGLLLLGGGGILMLSGYLRISLLKLFGTPHDRRH